MSEAVQQDHPLGGPMPDGRRRSGDTLSKVDFSRRYPLAEKLFSFIRTKQEKLPNLFQVTSVGEDELDSPILRMDSPEGRKDHRVVLIGSVHGDEPEGALALTYFCDDLFAQAQKHDVSLTIIPVANVGGYNAGTESSPELDGTLSPNLNRKWTTYEKSAMPPLIRHLKRALIDGGIPRVLVSVHSDEESNGFYLYTFGNRNELVKVIYDTALKFYKPEDEQALIGVKQEVGALALPGVVPNHPDGSIEDWLSTQGCEYSFCVDLPAQGRVRDRVRAVREIALAVIERTGSL